MRPNRTSNPIRSFYLCSAAGMALLVAGLAPAQAQQAGVVSAARNAPLAAGAPVQVGQRLVTGPQGGLHVLFLDQSAVLLGSNSALTVDRFSHDGKGGAIAMTLHAGSARVVGGKNSKAQPTLITTKQGQVAISGGVASVEAAQLATHATMLFGQQMRVTSTNGETQDITRPGFGTSMLSDDAARQQAEAIVAASSGFSALSDSTSSTQNLFDHFTNILNGGVSLAPDHFSSFLNTVADTGSLRALGVDSVRSLQSPQAQTLQGSTTGGATTGSATGGSTTAGSSTTAMQNTGATTPPVLAQDRLSLTDNTGVITPINPTVGIASPLNSIVPQAVVVPVTIIAPREPEPM